jgi:hypothetical protein
MAYDCAHSKINDKTTAAGEASLVYRGSRLEPCRKLWVYSWEFIEPGFAVRPGYPEEVGVVSVSIEYCAV